MRALQHYTDLTDVKRTIVNTHAIDPQVRSSMHVWGIESYWLWHSLNGKAKF